MKLSNLINGYGLDNGEKLIEWIEELMEKKECSKIITMKELYEKYNKELQIVVTDLKKVNQLTIDKTSDLKVIDCIRQAITIPFVLEKKEVEIPHRKLWVDISDTILRVNYNDLSSASPESLAPTLF